EVAGKAVRTFDDDGANAVAGDAVEHVLEARALGYRVAALHRWIVEPVDDGVAGGLGVALDRRPLARLAVLVAADVRCRRGAYLGDCFHFAFALAHHDLNPDL